VQILLVVRVLVMVPVVRGPPQGTPLSRAGPQNRKRELCRPAGFEGFVGEIAMVEARDREHPYQEKRNGKNHCESTDAGVKCQQTGKVESDEGQDSYPVKGSGVRIQVI